MELQWNRTCASRQLQEKAGGVSARRLFLLQSGKAIEW